LHDLEIDGALPCGAALVRAHSEPLIERHGIGHSDALVIVVRGRSTDVGARGCPSLRRTVAVGSDGFVTDAVCRAAGSPSWQRTPNNLSSRDGAFNTNSANRKNCSAG
jgi:hypothetical protein